MSFYSVPITGRLVDPFGEGQSGASVYFVSKATTRGVENVAQTAEASFTTDENGYYSASVVSGWYKIYFKTEDGLEPYKIGVATVEGVGATDLGTLIDNSIPPPSQLERITDVDVSGRQSGSLLSWNSSAREWQTAYRIADFASTGNQRLISTAITAGQSGVAVTFNPAFSSIPKVQVSLGVTGENLWLVSVRGLTANGFTGQFSDIVTDSNATLYTFAAVP